MPNYSHIVIEGHLGHDPEIKPSQSGSPWGTFSVAVAGWKDKEGGQKPTTWFNCKVFGYNAENMQGCKKGDAVVVIGRCETEEWEDRESGKKRSKLVVIAEHVHQLVHEKKAASPKPVSKKKQAEQDDDPNLPF